MKRNCWEAGIHVDWGTVPSREIVQGTWKQVFVYPGMLQEKEQKRVQENAQERDRPVPDGEEFYRCF